MVNQIKAKKIKMEKLSTMSDAFSCMNTNY